jgi:hypothetical protein
MATYYERQYGPSAHNLTNGLVMYPPSSKTVYIATGKPRDTRPKSDGGYTAEFPHTRLIVKHPSEEALFHRDDYVEGDFGKILDDEPDDFIERTVNRLEHKMLFDGSTYDERETELERQRNTPQMFYSEPAKVTGLYADPSMRHTVGTLGGLAVNQFGKTLSADSSLSKYSSPLVKRGLKAGVLAPNRANPSGNANNLISQEPVDEQWDIDSPAATSPNEGSTKNGPGRKIPRSRLDDARKTIHGVLRPIQHKTSPDQFGPFLPDPQLPGMEGY